jgi:RNA polymerase sigma-70 factor (ECF subfamily)
LQAKRIESTISKKLLDPDGAELDNLYMDYYPPLKRYAFTMVDDSGTAEEMVQQVFFKVLERKEPIEIHTSVKAYLYRSVHNQCLNFIKHQKVRKDFEIHSNQVMKEQHIGPAAKLQLKELEHLLKRAINELPEQCRTIFQLSRFEELKYAEIADQLGLSVKTVETQMSRALKKLRVRLADYLPLLVCLLINIIY